MMMHMVHDVPKLSGIDLNLLVVLRALLSERHVTRAARQLGLSQSATSHALSRLRELYADPLLVRSGRALELTPRAMALLPLLERGLHELEGSLRGEEPFDPKRAKLALRLGAADYAQAVLFGPLVALLQKEAPGIDLEAMSYPDLQAELEAGTIDIGIDTKRKLPRTLSQTVLFSDGFVCMLREGHPFTKRKLTLKAYLELGHLLVAPGGTRGSFVDTELAHRGQTRRVALQVASFLVAPQVVAETDLISTGPERLLRRVSTHYPIRILPTPLQLPGFDICLVWHTRRDHDPALSWLRSAIERVCAAF
jgi:DNA-binding transcriptional LysR family regulator